MLVGTTQVAHAQTSPAAREEINKAPLRELAVTVKTSLESKEFDFDKPFVVEYTGVISKDGKLDLRQANSLGSKVTRNVRTLPNRLSSQLAIVDTLLICEILASTMS